MPMCQGHNSNPTYITVWWKEPFLNMNGAQLDQIK